MTAETGKARVLFTHISAGGMPSFVANDLEILRARFHVTEFAYRGTEDMLRIALLSARHDLTVSWFAWDHAFWGNLAAILTGRRSLTIIGGFDVANLPEINYGNLLHAGPRRRTRVAIQLATIALAVSKSVRDDATRLSGRQDIGVMYHGLDASKFPLGLEKKPLVLTVGAVTPSNLSRKGIRTFIQAAEQLPDIPFLIAGSIDPQALELVGTLPPNLRLAGRVSDRDLTSLMTQAKVYVQVSAHEGFGVSIGEAMLCGCVPVVTDRGAIPEVVGDVGYVVPYDNPEETALAIHTAINSNGHLGARARDRIVNLFPVERRRQTLLAAAGKAMESRA